MRKPVRRGTKKKEATVEEKLREAIAEFENPANHAALDARLNPLLREDAREHDEDRRRSKEVGNDKVYR